MTATPINNLFSVCPCQICFKCCCNNPCCVNIDRKHPEDVCICKRSSDSLVGQDIWNLLDRCECGTIPHFIIQLVEDKEMAKVKCPNCYNTIDFCKHMTEAMITWNKYIRRQLGKI